MNIYLSILAAGFGGGMVRGLVGFIKHQYSFKKVGFDLPYFLGMNFLSAIVGILSAVAVKELGMGFFGDVFTPAMSFVIGYAGGDFLENIFKIIFQKTTLYSFPGKKE